MQLLAIAWLSLVLSGCFALKAENPNARVMEDIPDIEETSHLFLAGSAGVGYVTVTCKKGVAKVYEGFTFADVLLNIFTLLIYSPMTSRVHCVT